MSQSFIEIHIPTPLLQYGLQREDVQRRVTEWLVLSLFTEQRISSGKAARLLGINRIEFLDLLRLRGVAFIDFSSDELEEEFDSAAQLPDKQ